MSTASRSHIRRLALGRFISVTGGAAAYTALNFTIWHRTHNPWLQALSLLLTFGVTGMVGPFAGALGDHFDRRKVMIYSELVAAGFFFVMALFVSAPLMLILFAFGSAVAESPFWAASRAATPNLAETPEDIAWANSLTGIGWSSGVALGPVVGGLLLAAVGPSWVFAINAVSFLVSVLLTVSVRGRYSDENTAEEIEEHKGLTAGMRWLFREPVLRRMVLAWFVFVLGMGMGMVADASLAEYFHAGSVGFGLLVTCWGAGAVLGNAAGRWLNPRREIQWLVWAALGIGIMALGIGFSPVFPFVLGCLLLFGTFDGMSIVAENGIIQRRTPDAVRSRAIAAFEATLSIGLACAYVAAAPLLHLFGPRVMYRIAGVGALSAFVLLVPLLKVAKTVSADPSEDARTEAGLTHPGSSDTPLS